MQVIVEVDDNGAIQLPDTVLESVKPHTRFVVELQGERVILHPHGRSLSSLITSPAERAESIRRWAALERPSAPPLTDEMMSRDSIYD